MGLRPMVQHCILLSTAVLHGPTAHGSALHCAVQYTGPKAQWALQCAVAHSAKHCATPSATPTNTVRHGAK